MSKSYLGQHPSLYRSINISTERYSTSSKLADPIDMEAIAEQFINEQKERIHDLEMQIKAYQFKIKEEQGIDIDYSPQIEALEEEVRTSRTEEAYILQQIQNCRKVENQVTPMEYYLWKKKQRVNTYDASVAQLCKQIQQQREYYERSIEEHRRVNQELLNDIQQLEERIAVFNISSRQSMGFIEIDQEVERDTEESLLQEQKNLKAECQSLSSTIAIIEENRDIVNMQVVDNVESTVSSLKSFFEEERTRLIREFKQLQAQSKAMEVSPLTKDQMNYNIEPLLNDYAHKLGQLFAAAPENVKKVIQPILQPLPWRSFNWTQFLDIDPSSENIYDEYTRLHNQFMTVQSQTEKLQNQLKRINGDIAVQQQRYNQIQTHVNRMKKNVSR